jgi:hypothetical protein
MGHANEPVQLGSGNLDTGRLTGTYHPVEECFGEDVLHDNQRASRTLDDAKVAFCSGTECFKRLLICLAFLRREGDLVTV